jgi:hypothetical protein
VFQALLERIATAFDQAVIPYMVIGGQALLLYGEPRFTQDIDITLGLDVDGLESVLAIIESLGLFPLVEDVDAFVHKTWVLPVKDLATGIRVDFVFSISPYERQAIARSRPITVGQTMVHYASLEDLILHKLVAGRPRDLEDLRVLLRKNPGVDQAYLHHWFPQFSQTLDYDLEQRFLRLQEEA